VATFSELSLPGMICRWPIVGASTWSKPYNLSGAKVSPADVIYVNKSTEFQLAHYLCEQKPVVADRSVAGFESFHCNGLRVVSGEVMPTLVLQVAGAGGCVQPAARDQSVGS